MPSSDPTPTDGEHGPASSRPDSPVLVTRECIERMEIEHDYVGVKRSHPTTDEESLPIGSFVTDQGETVAITKGAKKRVVRSTATTLNIEKGQAGRSTKERKGSPSKQIGSGSETAGTKGRVAVKDMDKYDAFSRGPYIVHVRIPSDKNSFKRQMPMITMAKRLAKANVKYENICRYSRDTWKLSLASKGNANNILQNKIVKEMGMAVFIPRYKLSRKIVINGIPLDMELTELKQLIEDENSNVLITSLFRLKRRDRRSGQIVEAESVCLEIRGEALPRAIYILKTVNPVHPYIPRVRICFKCGRFGHLSKFCEGVPRCLVCAGDHQSSRESPCTNPNKVCINCEGKHSTFDRACPLYKRNFEIARVMAFDNLPFFEARGVVMGSRQGGEGMPTKSLQNFPTLQKNEELQEKPSAWRIQPNRIGQTNKDDRTMGQIQLLMERILKASNKDTLISRIIKTIELHNSIPDGGVKS